MLDSRGQMRTVEAFLSIVLLFSAIAAAALVSPASDFDSNEDLAALGMETLVTIDSEGQLGRLIEGRNWTALADLLGALLPTSISYNLTVCDESLRPINNSTITNGLIQNANTISVEYPCVSTRLGANYYLCRLQMAKPR